MNAILAIPLEVRLAGLFVAGLFVGSLVNVAVYGLAWHPRAIGPWLAPLKTAPPRRAADRLPVVGWFGLRREAGLHGAGFWIRPMLVELACGAGLAALYWWEIGRMALLPMSVPQALAIHVMPVLHAQFACHAALVSLMLAGSLLDIDERIIPDAITVPGTLLGLAAAAVYPWSLLTHWITMMPGRVDVEFMHLASPSPWPGVLGGFPLGWPLALGLGCWWAWCLALMPRTWYTRHGRLRAIWLCLARVRREAATWRLVALGVLGSLGIAAVWHCGGPWWTGLLSALVGMAASGGLVWAVRVIGTAVLGREAMGFGDVILMGMIGAFLGWQAGLMIFFIAPLAGLIIGLAGLLLGRGTEIPYGPFLALAAVAAIVRWPALWNWAVGTMSDLGIGNGAVVAAVLVCLVLLAVLLGLWRLVLSVFRTRR